MTAARITSWAFLLAAAFLLSVLIQQQTPGSSVAAPASTTQQPAPEPHRGLIVPVARVAPASLTDTWGQARAEGRRHEGVDIIAPRGAPVLAAADGRIIKFFDSDRGGVTIYQFDASERYVLYYAHLDSRAATLAEGDTVRQGDVIGFVGQTGNAPVPHLHFEIERLTPAKHWWEADAIDPYPYLMSGEAPN